MPTDRPLAWFSPLPRSLEMVPMPMFSVGQKDFMDLFQESAPWQTASGHARVFELNCGSVDYTLTNEQLRPVVADLERRGDFLAVEAAELAGTRLPDGSVCGDGVEGFDQQGTYDCLAKLNAVGGHVRYLAMDEPLTFGTFYDGPSACHWSIEETVAVLEEFVDRVHDIAPGLVVGDIEVLAAGQPVSAYTEFLDVYESVIGEKLPFFHLDIDYSIADWAERARELEDAVRARGIEFGVIYDGRFDDGSDAAWTAHAAETFAVIEGELGGHPEHVIFQSWNDRPWYNLPEDQADTFTHLVDRYFGPRTALTVSLGATAAQGTLTGGEPGAAITLTLTPLDGRGDVGDLTVSGSVPAGATTALLQAWMNMDCGGCSGPVDVDVYRESYVEGGGPNLVPNPDFSDGLAPWFFAGTGSATLEPSDQGSGNMLHLVATPDQTITLNGGEFAVTPGAEYTADFTLRVSPASVGSGYVTVIFLTSGAEFTRFSLPLATATLTRVATADAGGAFQIDLPAASGSRRRVDAGYAGDAERWPAFARATSP